MELSDRQQELFNTVKRKKEVTLDELIDKFSGSTVDRKNVRHAMIVRINNLSAKIAPYGWIIEKTSGVGRGAKAVYSIKKKF